MPRVLLTGDRPLIRTALRLLISSSSDLVVIGECANEPGLVSAAVSARPDVVIMNLDLDARCAAAPQQLAALIRSANGCPVLVLTGREEPKAITCALEQGVLGIVVDTRPADVLLRAIRGIAAGEAWLEQSIVAHLLHKRTARQNDYVAPAGKLTRREREIVELVSLGLQNKKIAERLFISETTVRHHLTSIYDKLSVTNRLELMRYTYTDRAAVA